MFRCSYKRREEKELATLVRGKSITARVGAARLPLRENRDLLQDRILLAFLPTAPTGDNPVYRDGDLEFDFI